MTRPLALLHVSLALLASCAARGTARAYDVITRTTPVVVARSVTVVGQRCVIQTGSGPVTMDRQDVDFYKTFRKNLGQGGGNVVVFSTGSMLRFDTIDMSKSGEARFTVEGGGLFTVPESLIDYEASVIEGATVQLPKGAGATVAVSRGQGDNGNTSIGYEDGGGYDPATSGAPSAIARSRRLARPPGAPLDKGAGSGDFPPEAGLDVGDGTAENSGHDAQAGGARPGGQMTGSAFDRRRPGGSNPGTTPGGSEEDPPTGGGPILTTTLLLSTDYSSEMQGIQLLLKYPQNCQAVAPIQFSGFASGLMAAVNTGVNPLNIAGVAGSIGSMRGPGEFLRVTFNCTDHVPGMQDFSVLQPTAVDPAGQRIGEFQIGLTQQ